MSSAPQLPKTTVEVLERDEELKYTVFTLLTSGWSPARISRHIYKTRGDALPVRDIKTFADELPPSLILPVGYLRDKYKQFDLQIDAANVLAAIIRHTEERLRVACLVESVAGEENKTLSELVTHLEGRLFDYSERYVKLLQTLGDFPRASDQIAVSVEKVEEHPTLRQLLDEKDDSGAETG